MGEANESGVLEAALNQYDFVVPKSGNPFKSTSRIPTFENNDLISVALASDSRSGNFGVGRVFEHPGISILQRAGQPPSVA